MKESPVDRILALKRQLDAERTRSARLEGELSHVLQQLREAGIKSLKDGEIQQKEREARIAELEENLATGLETLQNRWGKELED